MEDMKIKIKGSERKMEFTCNPEQSIMDVLVKNGVRINAACGGRGKCGKCTIRVREGRLAVSSEDHNAFTKEELAKGFRLSCKAYPTEDITISLEMKKENKMTVLSDYKKRERINNKNRKEKDKTPVKSKICVNKAPQFLLGIDIGTTTIAIELLEKETGNTVDIYTAINNQRSFGADVISRIKASVDGKGKELRNSICSDLVEGILCLIKRNKGKSPSHITIAGNTTMIHLLMGYPCDTLGVFPFEPVNINTIETNCQSLFEGILLERDHLEKVPVTILPGFSTFVGGDILAGLLANAFDQNDKICALVDLGTNGEMAVGNKDRILVTSTAAGPAFEGGNISCGIGSIPGAICGCEILEGNTTVRTINDAEAIGICGTGAIETLSELVCAGLVDETGLLCEEYFKTGFFLAKEPSGKEIVLTQKDIRELQLAKAAVRAGFEILLRRYGIGYEEIDKIYLAGGFGYKMNVKKAISIGLFPAELEEKMEAVGNSSLSGASAYQLSSENETNVEKLIASATEINLASDRDFNETYMDQMMFE